jgi:ribosomal protein L3
MGLDRITIKHREVIVSDPAEKIIAVKGAVPGPNGSMVILNVESLPAKSS